MSREFTRVVLDTNILISAFLVPGSLPSLVLGLVQRSGMILVCADTLAELSSVLLRSKFDRYSPVATRVRCLIDFRNSVRVVETTSHITVCRDPKDNIFLALALDGRADFLLTGDDDLLALHPWRGVAILTPAAYLALPEIQT